MSMTRKQKKALSLRMKAMWAAKRAAKAAQTPEVPTFKQLDPVNAPAHYVLGGIECIEYMKQVLTPEEYVGYLRGCVIKYQHRLRTKDTPGLNAGKLAWYAARLAAEIE